MLISMSKYISNKAKQKQYLQTAGNHLHCLKSSSALRNWSVFFLLFFFFSCIENLGARAMGLMYPVLEANWLLRWNRRAKPNWALPCSGQ